METFKTILDTYKILIDDGRADISRGELPAKMRKRLHPFAVTIKRVPKKGPRSIPYI